MSNQGFGGDDDDEKNDIERLLDGFKSAKKWYDNNKDLFERFSAAGNSVDLAGGEPISEAHVDEDKVLIVADVSGVKSTRLQLEFYDNKIEAKLGDREFSVDVPSDVDEDSIEADMKNGVLRVEIERENSGDNDITVDTIDAKQDNLGKWESEDPDVVEDEVDRDELEKLFDDDGETEDDDNGGEE